MFGTWGQGKDSICVEYYSLLGGGMILPRILGVIIGILNNISFAIIKGLSMRIGFREKINM